MKIDPIEAVQETVRVDVLAIEEEVEAPWHLKPGCILSFRCIVCQPTFCSSPRSSVAKTSVPITNWWSPCGAHCSLVLPIANLWSPSQAAHCPQAAGAGCLTWLGAELDLVFYFHILAGGSGALMRNKCIHTALRILGYIWTCTSTSWPVSNFM